MENFQRPAITLRNLNFHPKNYGIPNSQINFTGRNFWKNFIQSTISSGKNFGL